MPIRFKKFGEVARIYENPFVGPVDHQVGILVDVTELSTDEVDSLGYLKPAIPFTREGGLVGAGGTLFGVSIEEIKVAEGNSTDDLTAAGTVEVAVATIAQVNQSVAEDLLGREYTAAEVTAFNAAGSKVVLLTPTA
jgi:hypothetical protein